MFYQSLITSPTTYFAHRGTCDYYPMHWHSEIEVLYVIAGKLTVNTTNNSYTLNQGDILVTMCGIPHEVNTKEYNLTLCLEFGYSLLGPDFSVFNDRVLKNPYIPGERQESEFLLPIQEIVGILEHDEYSPASKWNIESRLLMIASKILSMTERSANPSNSNISSVYPVIEYIQQHYSENISLSDLSEVTGYNGSYLCRQFKSLVGTTIHNYVNYFRIEVACRLLRQTGQSVNDIALQTGFPSSIQFCRVFKNFTGLTPSQYRSMDSVDLPIPKPI